MSLLRPGPGNKVADRHENPIDIVILRVSSHLVPIFRRLNHTPNMLTTYSFLFGLLAVYQLHRGNLRIFVFLFVISYVFDCMDGQMARRYDMVTVFGDIYDHCTDVIVLVLLILVVWRKYYKVLKWQHLAILLVFIYLNSMSFGCQQQMSNMQGIESIDMLRNMCPSSDAVHWTRFFGAGTLNLLILVMVVHLHRRSVRA